MANAYWREIPKKARKTNWWLLAGIPVGLIVVAYLFRGVFAAADSADFWAKQGQQFFKSYEYQRAIESFQTAIKKDPNNPTYICELGRCYTRLGDMERAMEQFNNATSIKEDFPDAIVGEAEAYFTMGKTDRAEQMYQKATELVTGNADIYIKLGQIALGRSDFESALTMYQKAKEIDPSSAEAERGIELAEQARTRAENNSANTTPRSPAEEEHISTGMGDDSPSSSPPPSDEPPSLGN